MRLSFKLLSSDSSLNNLQYIDQLEISRGENVNIYFQLWDNQKDQRYVPPSGYDPETSLQVIFPVSPSILPDINNTRKTVDFTLTKAAAFAFNDDRSIWYIALSSDETQAIVSNKMQITLTENPSGIVTKIAVNSMAIRMIDG